jgi:uncharacterized protein (TIGR02001 family)
MRKLLLSTAVLAAFSLPATVFAQTPAPAAGGAAGAGAAPAAAPTPEHTFTSNVGLFSDYRFRGISQTYKQPALQGGFDYSHSSGIYLGTWGSNVSNNVYPNGNLEWDLYGGYKFEPVKDVGLDLGLIYYYYPGAKTLPPNQPAPAFAPVGATATSTGVKNFEWYMGATYSYFSGKFSYSMTDLFGLNNAFITGFSSPAGITAAAPLCGLQSNGTAATTNCYTSAPGNSKGSSYVDLAFNYPFGDKWSFGMHAGHQKVKNWTNHSYSDYKIGLSKEYSGFSFGANYIWTNAKSEWYRYTTPGFAAPPAVANAGQDIKDLSRGTLVLSVSKTF